MDIDRFIATYRPVWDRLAQLSARPRRGKSRLDAEEIGELVVLYQRTSTHLSVARTSFADPGLTARLSRLLGTSRQVIYGTRPRTLRSFGRFFTTILPAALWHARRSMLVAAVLTFAPTVVVGVWLANSPSALDVAAPPALRQAYVEHNFADYYKEQPSAQFAAQVYTNNVKVAILAFGSGVLLCALTAYILVANGANLGFALGLFGAAGKLPLAFGLLIPHGLIELTSVVIAGGAGLRLGWSIISPGDRPRAVALAEEGKRSVVLVFGCVFTLLVAGTIEGFVTGSALSTWVRVGIGVGVEVAFLTYAWGFGRRAATRGLTGLLGEDDHGWATLAE